MPGLNGTGPTGAGPMTGGRRGLCNTAGSGYRSQPLGNGMNFNRGMGRGFGRGFGNGYGMGMARGFGRGIGWSQAPFYAQYQANPDEELSILKARADAAQNNLNAINRRISELENSSD